MVGRTVLIFKTRAYRSWQRFHLMHIVHIYYYVFAWIRMRNTYLRIVVASSKIDMFRVNILSLSIVCSVIMAMAFADILLKNSWQS